MDTVVKRSLVTEDFDPIYSEALTALYAVFTEYVEILLHTRPKILKLRFNSGTSC